MTDRLLTLRLLGSASGLDGWPGPPAHGGAAVAAPGAAGCRPEHWPHGVRIVHGGGAGLRPGLVDMGVAVRMAALDPLSGRDRCRAR